MFKDLESYATWRNRGITYTGDGLELKIEGSYWTGRETIWVNDEELSHKTSWRFRTVHEFHLDADEYKVAYKMGNIFTGQVIISVWKNGHEILSDENSMLSGWQAFFMLPASICIGILLGNFAINFLIFLGL